MESPDSMEAAALTPLIDEANAAQSEMLEAMAPEGPFTAPAIRDVAKALSQALSHYGPAAADMLKDLRAEKGAAAEELPESIARAMPPVIDAINDAVEADVLDAEMRINLDGMSGDDALREVSARARMAAGSRDFRKFLKEEQEEEEEGAAADEEAAAADDDADDEDALFMARM